jgi:glycosyltransferase involved in cell wall biosynthesis
MRIAILTEIPAPFRIPIWNALATREGVELEVAFLAAEQPNRPYLLHRDEWRFAGRVLPGVRSTVRGRWTALNAGVVRLVRRSDVVVVGGWNQPAFWQAAAAAKLLRRPLVVWVETTARDAGCRAGRAKRTLVAAADAVIVPGRASSEYARSLGAREIVVAPNAIDLSIFRDRVAAERTRRDELRRELGLEGFAFLAIGRLAPEKGFDALLEALPEVPGATVALLGAGPEERRLRAAAPAGVRFVGNVPRDELPRWLAAADALVAPSRAEPWGFAIQEAAAAGLPVVATEAAGAAWDLVDEEFRVPVDEPAALAAAMRKVVDGETARADDRAAALTADAWADAVAALALRLHGSAHGRQ